MYTLNRKPSPFFDLLRILLIPLSLIVAAALTLTLLPQAAADSIIRDLQTYRGVDTHEKIAFLYLGHQIRNNRFHIRGVVRNISGEPIDQLDATVRLYSQGRSLMETTVVRLNKETIAPDEIARFDLVYPDYKSQFSGYSVEFKLRNGKIIPYMDARESVTKTAGKSASGAVYR